MSCSFSAACFQVLALLWRQIPWSHSCMFGIRYGGGMELDFAWNCRMYNVWVASMTAPLRVTKGGVDTPDNKMHANVQAIFAPFHTHIVGLSFRSSRGRWFGCITHQCCFISEYASGGLVWTQTLLTHAPRRTSLWVNIRPNDPFFQREWEIQWEVDAGSCFGLESGWRGREAVRYLLEDERVKPCIPHLTCFLYSVQCIFQFCLQANHLLLTTPSLSVERDWAAFCNRGKGLMFTCLLFCACLLRREVLN